MRGKCIVLAVVAMSAAGSMATAAVFINEIAVNPPGSLDESNEFIELMGTPGKKLDGYALVLLTGGVEKYYTQGSIPPPPSNDNDIKEIDEFFSLDGLSLGANGLLVIGIGPVQNYLEVLSDTAFFGPWEDLWNGGLDVPGKLQNDGSNTILLIRNRPGITEADPANPGGLRWGKTRRADFELIRNVIDPRDGVLKDQFGDGDLDIGQPNGIQGNTQDFLGVTLSAEDQLEIVDEVSYESERGWEYDLDDRHVDAGSLHGGLPDRRVHALDDPQGFNPDVLTRVDYRTKGPGWTPAPGATGELQNGKNWQDTATEQWIRGENEVKQPVVPPGPEIYYTNFANGNPDAIQPYDTQVPRWLNDFVGAEHNFSTRYWYRIMPGRVNPLAIPFIPGDADRDGDCDADDVSKIAAVFGDDDWLFINSYADAPEGNDGDPALQTRPWDVDATGDNGIEASDLQWTLNFLGNTNGRIVGRRYDSTTPAAGGVYLNSNAAVGCTVSWVAHVPSGRPIDGLAVGDVVELTARAQVTAGARTSPADQNNGVMQFVHDLRISVGGVVRVEQVDALAPFAITRPDLIQPNGATDRGALTINGHATVYSEGLGAASGLYRVTLTAVSMGSALVTVTPAAHANLAASAPRGLKVGRTDHHGDPNSVAYPAALVVAVTQQAVLPGNCDPDPQITLSDYLCLSGCITGPAVEHGPTCAAFDLNGDHDVDLSDVADFAIVFGE